MEYECECPKCKSECVRDEIDVGVGSVCGTWHCINCGWEMADDNPFKDAMDKYRVEEGV